MDIKLIIVIENCIYREGISHFLMQEHEFSLLSIYTPCEVSSQQIGADDADVLVVDHNISYFMDSLVQIKLKRPLLKIVMVTYSNCDDHLSACISAGVEGVITKSDSMNDLKNCIISVHSGHMYYPAHFCQYMQRYGISHNTNSSTDVLLEMRLTLRQVKVMKLIEQGHSNKKIAQTLNIELSTVKNHVHHILEKLQVKNRCEAASVFRRNVNFHP